MPSIDEIYKLWSESVLMEYYTITPDIDNENHIFELGKVLTTLNLDSFLIENIIETIKNRNKIILLTEERERKVPPGHILVKNKKSGYLYVILKSTYSDNPERYSLPTNYEKSQWESGVEDPEERPEDDLVKTPRVSKSKIKADVNDADIVLKGDVEDEEPQNAIQEPSDSGSIFDYGINKKHFLNKKRLVNDDEFTKKRKSLKLQLPETLDPYKVPDEVKEIARVPVIYLEIIERIINTYNIEQAAELNFYVNDLKIPGDLKDQLGQLISIINLTLSDEVSSYFTEDLTRYGDYLKDYDRSNETTYADDSALDKDWVKKAEKTRKKMLNFLAEKFTAEFIIIAATSSDPQDVKALDVGSKKDKKPGDANVKISVNDKEQWLRIKLETPKKQNTDDEEQEAESDQKPTSDQETE